MSVNDWMSVSVTACSGNSCYEMSSQATWSFRYGFTANVANANTFQILSRRADRCNKVLFILSTLIWITKSLNTGDSKVTAVICPSPCLLMAHNVHFLIHLDFWADIDSSLASLDYIPVNVAESFIVSYRKLLYWDTFLIINWLCSNAYT